MNRHACEHSIINNIFKNKGLEIIFNAFSSTALFGLLLFTSAIVSAEEPYSADIDATDNWAGSNVANFLDVNSTISNEASALQLQVNATVGVINGTSNYSATNPNGDEEITVNIAAQSGQQAEIVWTFNQTVFPLGVNNPSFTLRDVDDNTSGFLEDPPGSSNEFCDRIEVRAFDVNGTAIAANNFSASTGTAPTTFATIAASPGTPANSFVIEGNANDTAGTSEAVIALNATNVAQIRVIYEQCETADTDRPGAIGIVNGFGDFSIYTTDLAVNKEWRNAAVGDQATVTVSGGTVTTLPSLSSTANSANETDTGTAREVISGVEYSINETFNAGNTFSYINSLSCTGTGDSDVSDGNLTPTASDTSIVCTYLNRLPEADVSVTKTDGELEFAPGQSATYQIVVTNNGPEAADGIVVTDTLPPGLASATWSCAATGGAVCANANGSGNIAETISSLPNGATVTFTVNGTFDTDPSNY